MNYLEAIYETYIECNIREFPIDCFEMLRHYGFRIMTYSELREIDRELFDLCISYSDDAFADKVNYIVGYNERANAQRIRFSLMHELGHYKLGHIGHCIQYENEADTFASHILAPRSMFKALKCSNAVDVHNAFNISYAAANRAWLNYRSVPLTDSDERIYELFFPPIPEKNIITPEIKENRPNKISQPSPPQYIPSKAFEERRQKALRQIRRRRNKIQKELKELQEDLSFLRSIDPAFNRAGYEWNT